MKLSAKLIFLLVILQLTINCYGDTSKVTLKILPRVDLKGTTTKKLGEMTKILENLKQTLSDSINKFHDFAMATINSLSTNLTDSFDDAQHQIDQLRADNSDAKFEVCFPINFLPDLLKHALHGVKTCVMEIFLMPYNAARTLLEEIDNILKIVATFPGKVEKCGRFGIVCLTKLLTVDIAETVMDVGNAYFAVTSTMLYLSDLQYSFLPCTVLAAKYPSLAWDYVARAGKCVSNIANAIIP